MTEICYNVTVLEVETLQKETTKHNTHTFMLMNRRFRDLNPLFYGYEHCDVGKSHGPAVRKYTLIHYVVYGEGRVVKENREYTVHGGEAFLIHPHEVVTYFADTQDPWYYQWIAFDGSLSDHFAELPVVIPFPADFMQKVMEAGEQEMAEYRIAALLFSLYAELFEEKQTRNHYVRQVQDRIRALYMQPLRIEQIAEDMNLDRRYLSRVFKQKTGQTIQEYLISVRIEESMRLLEEGRTVEESAYLCGYEDPFNFSKMFKKRVGMSPRQWKNKNGG